MACRCVIVLIMRKLQALSAALTLVSACYAQAPARLEFEAASVKPIPEGDVVSVFCKGGPGSTDPGLFRCRNFSLSSLISRAYGLKPNQLIAPDWANSARFDIDAKVPDGTSEEALQQMLQNLLADRFKLAVHHETRESTEYRLVVAKGGPKFKPAANEKPAESNPDGNSPPPAPKMPKKDPEGYPVFEDGRSGMAMVRGGRAHMAEPRMTIARLAAWISAELSAHVTDDTGLEGEFAIDLRWVIDKGFGVTDDTPGPRLIEAVQQQLGLRLEKSANGTKDVLVVDRAEKAPTAN
jgi:uncharacterized protein (TIGR03435 family)